MLLNCASLRCQGMEDEVICTEARLQPTERCWGEAEHGQALGKIYTRVLHPPHNCPPTPSLSWPQRHTRKFYSQYQHIAGQSIGNVGEPTPCLSSFYQRHWPHTPPSSDFPGSIFAPCHLQHLLGPARTAKNLLWPLGKGFCSAPTSMPKTALAHRHTPRGESLLFWAATHHLSCGFWTMTERTLCPQTTFPSWLPVSVIHFHSHFMWEIQQEDTAFYFFWRQLSHTLHSFQEV